MAAVRAAAGQLGSAARQLARAAWSGQPAESQLALPPALAPPMQVGEGHEACLPGAVPTQPHSQLPRCDGSVLELMAALRPGPVQVVDGHESCLTCAVAGLNCLAPCTTRGCAACEQRGASCRAGGAAPARLPALLGCQQQRAACLPACLPALMPPPRPRPACRSPQRPDPPATLPQARAASSWAAPAPSLAPTGPSLVASRSRFGPASPTSYSLAPCGVVPAPARSSTGRRRLPRAAPRRAWLCSPLC